MATSVWQIARLVDSSMEARPCITRLTAASDNCPKTPVDVYNYPKHNIKKRIAKGQCEKRNKTFHSEGRHSPSNAFHKAWRHRENTRLTNTILNTSSPGRQEHQMWHWYSNTTRNIEDNNKHATWIWLHIIQTPSNNTAPCNQADMQNATNDIPVSCTDRSAWHHHAIQ